MLPTGRAASDVKAPSDQWEVDVRRNHSFQRNRKYLRERVSESLGLRC